MDDKTRICKYCKHFRFHYIKRGFVYLPIEDGHCVYPRLKRRVASDTCAHWTVRAE